MGAITAITFSANKTLQEKQYEPIRLEVTMTYMPDDGEDVAKATEDLEFRVFQELHSAVNRYFKVREERHEALSKKRHELVAVNQELSHF